LFVTNAYRQPLVALPEDEYTRLQNHWVTAIESGLLDDRLRELPVVVVSAVQVLLAGSNAEAQSLLALSAHPVFSFRKMGDLRIECVLVSCIVTFSAHHDVIVFVRPLMRAALRNKATEFLVEFIKAEISNAATRVGDSGERLASIRSFALLYHLIFLEVFFPLTSIRSQVRSGALRVGRGFDRYWRRS
jgi:hypothetical protein